MRWGESTSAFFIIRLGVRQGSVLAPYLFAVYVNDIAGKYQIGQRSFVILYADDILIISASVCDLQNLLHKCEIELKWLNMAINAKKSCGIRVGPHCDVSCANILSTDGSIIPGSAKSATWVYFSLNHNASKSLWYMLKIVLPRS